MSFSVFPPAHPLRHRMRPVEWRVPFSTETYSLSSITLIRGEIPHGGKTENGFSRRKFCSFNRCVFRRFPPRLRKNSEPDFKPVVKERAKNGLPWEPRKGVQWQSEERPGLF
jgi:hypothetical protein